MYDFEALTDTELDAVRGELVEGLAQVYVREDRVTQIVHDGRVIGYLVDMRQGGTLDEHAG